MGGSGRKLQDRREGVAGRAGGPGPGPGSKGPAKVIFKEKIDCSLGPGGTKSPPFLPCAACWRKCSLHSDIKHFCSMLSYGPLFADKFSKFADDKPPSLPKAPGF